MKDIIDVEKFQTIEQNRCYWRR